jgi:hypothetical protein
MNSPLARTAVLHFSHETVSFLKNDTTLEDFIYPGSPAKGEALLKSYPKAYMGGFVKMAREFVAQRFKRMGNRVIGTPLLTVDPLNRIGIGYSSDKQGLQALC